ncbi:hypothetical protein PCE1_000953 [Barthelona sp. PCE]
MEEVDSAGASPKSEEISMEERAKTIQFSGKQDQELLDLCQSNNYKGNLTNLQKTYPMHDINSRLFGWLYGVAPLKYDISSIKPHVQSKRVAWTAEEDQTMLINRPKMPLQDVLINFRHVFHPTRTPKTMEGRYYKIRKKGSGVQKKTDTWLVDANNIPQLKDSNLPKYDRNELPFTLPILFSLQGRFDCFYGIHECVTVGRSKKAHINLSNEGICPLVSKLHFAIRLNCEKKCFELKKFGKNWLYVNDTEITQTVFLNNGDLILLPGQVILQFFFSDLVLRQYLLLKEKGLK